MPLQARAQTDPSLIAPWSGRVVANVALFATPAEIFRPRSALQRSVMGTVVAQSLRSVEVPGQPPQPVAGEQAAGHGVFRRIVAIPDVQPLASDDIWRVALEGEAVIRVVRLRSGMGGARWELLAMGDMTDEQLDAYESAIADNREEQPGTPSALGI